MLGLEGIGLGVDFFDLGGTSLDALAMLETVRKTFELEVPFDLFWRDGTTVRRLAEILASRQIEPFWQQPMAFCANGANQRLFFAHMVGGNLHPYRRLARFVDPAWDVCGLPAKGMDQERLPHHRMEEMAAHCIALLRQVQNRGPYALIGHCSGGVLAYEIAQQLRRDGDEIGLLFIIDAMAPPYPAFGNLQAYLDFARPSNARLLQERLYYLALSYLGLERLRKLERLAEAHRWALWSYQPQPYEGDIVLCRPVDHQYSKD